MGRKRTIDRAVTMAAIEAVVLRDGVGGLSIDAVAREAGISKSSVVYDFRNKSGLLAAFTRNCMEAHRDRLLELRESTEGTDRWLRAAIRDSRETLCVEDTEVAMKLAAATHSSEECHEVMCQEISGFLEMAKKDANDQRSTLLAFVALHGLKCLEYFNFQRFDSDTRTQLLTDIAWLLDAGLPEAIAETESPLP